MTRERRTALVPTLSEVLFGVSLAPPFDGLKVAILPGILLQLDTDRLVIQKVPPYLCLRKQLTPSSGADRRPLAAMWKGERSGCSESTTETDPRQFFLSMLGRLGGRGDAKIFSERPKGGLILQPAPELSSGQERVRLVC